MLGSQLINAMGDVRVAQAEVARLTKLAGAATGKSVLGVEDLIRYGGKQPGGKAAAQDFVQTLDGVLANGEPNTDSVIPRLFRAAEAFETNGVKAEALEARGIARELLEVRSRMQRVVDHSAANTQAAAGEDMLRTIVNADAPEFGKAAGHTFKELERSTARLGALVKDAAPEVSAAKRKRALVIGLGGLGVATAAGGAAWYFAMGPGSGK